MSQSSASYTLAALFSFFWFSYWGLPGWDLVCFGLFQPIITLSPYVGLDPSSRLIQRSYDLCGGNWSAPSPEKTSRNSWYSDGMSEDLSVGVFSSVVVSVLLDRAVMVISDDVLGWARNRAFPFFRLNLVKS